MLLLANVPGNWNLDITSKAINVKTKTEGVTLCSQWYIFVQESWRQQLPPNVGAFHRLDTLPDISTEYHTINFLQQLTYVEVYSSIGNKKKSTKTFTTLFSNNWIQSTIPYPIYLKFVLILSCHLPLDLSSSLLRSGFHSKIANIFPILFT